MSKVALLLPYSLKGPHGPQVYLQRHSDRLTWRLFGGHAEPGENPLETIIRETREELRCALNSQTLGEGWTPLQILCRLRVSFGGVYLFPVEADPSALPDGLEPGEGAEGRWWPVKRLPATLSFADRMLIKAWTLRRFVLNQPYITTRLQCPVLTVDLEEPQHYAGRPGGEGWARGGSGLCGTIEGLLEHLKRAGATATFFCVASTARRYKALIRAIALRNEVASHGTEHQLASTQSLVQFQEDIGTSKATLEDITGGPVKGYRAPGWSWPRDANQGDRWYDALAKAGYLYDSSVIPAAIIGAPGGPSIPYRTDADVYEFPLPCCGVPLVTKNLERFAKDGTYRPPPRAWRGAISTPYSGGIFLRCFGTRFSSLILSYHLKKRGYAMVYVHPGELSGDDASWVKGLDRRYLNPCERWRMGFRTSGLKAHFFSLVAKYSGCSIKEFLDDTGSVVCPDS